MATQFNGSDGPRALVQVSGGAASFLAWKYAAEEFGPRNTDALFADVKTEHPDLYRFLDDCQRQLDLPLIRLADGRTPWEVFFDEGMIGNTRADLCSRILKRDVLDRWRAENTTPTSHVIILGMDANEPHRLEGAAKRHEPWKVRAPLIERGIFKERALELVRAEGLVLSTSYDDGFPHDNCGGACIKAGHAQWAHLLKTRPAVYAYHEGEEDRFRAETGKNVSILRDRRSGTTRPLTLADLRRRVEQTPQEIDLFDWGGCGCMESAA